MPWGQDSKQDNAQKWEMRLISQDQPEGAPSSSPKEVTADTAQVPAGTHVGSGPGVVEMEWGRSERDLGCPGPPALRSQRQAGSTESQRGWASAGEVSSALTEGEKNQPD